MLFFPNTRRLISKAIIVALVVCAATLWAAVKLKPVLSITPLVSWADTPVHIKVSGLRAGETIKLRAWMTNPVDGLTFRSEAVFVADARGHVDPSTLAPTQGSYTGIDGMGLFWSMRPTAPGATRFVFIDRPNGKPLQVHLELLSSQGRLLANTTIERLLSESSLEEHIVHDDGLSGILFYPKAGKGTGGQGSWPAVLLIPGSGGVVPNASAKVLAQHGYLVLALTYFGAERLPQYLENVPLEYFQKAVQYLRQHPMSNYRVAALGVGRGAEAALLAASVFPNLVDALVAYCPTSFVYGGFPYPNRPAWLYHDKPYKPFIGGFTAQDLWLTRKDDLVNFVQNRSTAGSVRDPFRSSDLFLRSFYEQPQTHYAAAIPVENLLCPLLLISGEQDAMWPSSLYGQIIMQRLDHMGSSIPRLHLQFPQAGHNLLELPYLPFGDNVVYHPVGGYWCCLGGSIAGNAAASQSAWKHILDFLSQLQHIQLPMPFKKQG